MLKEERHEQIVKMLQAHGSIEVSQLCNLFGVTDMTVRRDLEHLEDIGMVVRNHGGATLSKNVLLLEQPHETRLNIAKEEKEAIGRAAAKLIESGQKIFINSGATTLYLAKAIDNTKKLIVGTDSIRIAYELSTRTNLTIISIGGEMRHNTYSCDGYFAENMILQLRFNTCFFGITGIGNDGNLYAGSLSSQSKYHALFKSTRRKIALADHTKFGNEDFACVGNIKQMDCLVTDSQAPDAMVKKIRDLGVTVIIAES